MDINTRKRRINKLIDSVDDRRLDNNPVAEAARLYLLARQEAVDVARNRGYAGLDGKNNKDLRAILFRLGEDLSDQFPEFDRLWNRILFNEVDPSLEM
jgi:hypothetical protein